MPDFHANRKKRRDTRHQLSRSGKRQLNQSVQRSFQYRRDIMRRGTPAEILQTLEEQHEATTDIATPQLEQIEEGLVPTADSEVLLTDEDSIADEENLIDPILDIPFSLNSAGWSVDLDNSIVIVVIDGEAVFRIPDWATALADADLELRWHTYQALATWLNEERKALLAEPCALNLGNGNIDFTAPVPVIQQGLYQTLGLSCDVTTFSKHCRCGMLVWPNRTLPVESLWSHDAKLSWCAWAARHRQQVCGYANSASPLGDPYIRPLRSKAEKDRLRSRARSAMSLGPIEFVQLLCILADCSWRDVLSRYRQTIFYEEDLA